MATANIQREGNAVGNDVRPGELVFWKEGVYFAKEVTDINASLPKAIEKLEGMDYAVVGVTIYKGNVRLLLHPKSKHRKGKQERSSMTKKGKFAEYMRRRYWLQKHGCEPPSKKGKRHKEDIQ